jgi:hypothetical protein
MSFQSLHRELQKLTKKVPSLILQTTTSITDIQNSLQILKGLCSRLEILQRDSGSLGVLTLFFNVISALKADHLRQMELIVSLCSNCVDDIGTAVTTLNELCTDAFQRYSSHSQVLSVEQLSQPSAPLPAISLILEWFDWLYRAYALQASCIGAIIGDIKLFTIGFSEGAIIGSDIQTKFATWNSRIMECRVDEVRVNFIIASWSARIPLEVTI